MGARWWAHRPFAWVVLPLTRRGGLNNRERPVPALDGDTEPCANGATDRLLDRGDGGGGVDQHAALRLRLRDLLKALAQSLVKIPAHLLEPVSPTRPSTGSRKSNIDRQIEDQSEIWLEAAGDQGVERCQRLPGQAAAISLVGQGRIDKAVANYPIPAVERRPHGFDQVIATRRHHEERLALGVPALWRALDEQLTDFFSARRAPGLTRAQGHLPGLAQCIDQEFGLGRFPRTLAAFERDESTPAQRLPQTR